MASAFLPGAINYPLSRFFLNPVRVVWSEPGSGTIEKPEAVLTDDDSCCVLRPGSGAGPSLIVDFGEELNGGISLEVARCTPTMHAKIRIRFGESVSEVMGEPNNDHAIHDFVLNFPGMARQEIGLTGFRFVRIDLLDPENGMDIRKLQAVAVERDYKYLGTFESSDPLIDRVWKAGARTVHLCCQDYLVDGIKRDRLVWIGDLHPQLHVVASVFGGVDIIPQSLNLLRDRTWPDVWMNGFASYSLWWILSIWDWYTYTGDRAFLADQGEFLAALIDRIAAETEPSGRAALKGAWLVDWAIFRDSEATAQGVQAHAVWAVQCAERIAQALDRTGLAETCRSTAARLRAAEYPPSKVKQVNALRVLAGLADAQTANREVLSRDPAAGLSPWFGLYILQARSLAGDVAGCLDLLRKYWGGMLSLGATTYWEHFDIDWLKDAGRIDEFTPPGKHDVHVEYGDHCYKGLRHSFCHGWGGGPAAWLMRDVLGVLPLAPGYRKIRLAPNLGDLEFARGTFPTPQGIIRVSHARGRDGQVKTEYEVPREIEVES